MEPSTENPYPRSRNPRACESCRISKSRCFASDQPGICQKCLRSNLSCVVRATARPRRTKKSISPIEEQGVPEGVTFEDEGDSKGFYVKLDNVQMPDTKDSIAALEQHHHGVFNSIFPVEHQGMLPPTPATTVNTPRSTRTETVNLKQNNPKYLGYDQAEKLLLSFHEMAPFFPFVVVPMDATVKSLSQKSPFLLLAILTATSVTNIQLNFQLDHEFKRVLSEKVILEGRRSLDFLQGLLVYNAWYPVHLRPRSRQSFMYMNLAISLADDLGLGQRFTSLSGMYPDNIGPEGLFEDGGISKAAQRAYLGTYYLTSAFSMAFQKQTIMKYGNLIDEYGRALAKDAEIWSDLEILPLVRSNYIQERVVDSLHARERSAESLWSLPFGAEMQGQVFYNEVEGWRRSLSEEIKPSSLLVLTERFLLMSVLSEDLLYFRPIPAPPNQQYNPATLSKSLEANKKFFESLLSVPSTQYRAFTNVQWGHMIHAIVTLSRLSFPIARSPSWDPIIAQQYAPLGMFLESLCYRMQGLSTTPPTEPAPKNPDGPYVFRMVLESIRKSHERRLTAFSLDPSITRESTSAYDDFSSGTEKLSCPMNDPSLKTFIEPSPIDENTDPAFPKGSATAGNILVYHDLWATMTMSWSDH